MVKKEQIHFYQSKAMGDRRRERDREREKGTDRETL